MINDNDNGLMIPLFAAMVGMLALVGLNSVNAQNMSTPGTNMWHKHDKLYNYRKL